MSLTNRCFYSCPILFFCNWDGWEKGGRIPAIHFIPLRGLDFSRETKVTRLHLIHQIQHKSSPSSQAIPQPSCRPKLIHNFVFAPWQAFKSIWSCSSKSPIPAAVEQQGIYIWLQCGRRTAFVSRFALKKPFPHLMYFLPSLSSPHHYTLTLQLQAVEIFPANAILQCLPTLCLSSHIWAKCKCIALCSRILLGKMCLEECGQTKVQKSVRKSMTISPQEQVFASGKICSCGESLSPLEQRRCKNSACCFTINSISKISKNPKYKYHSEDCWNVILLCIYTVTCKQEFTVG